MLIKSQKWKYITLSQFEFVKNGLLICYDRYLVIHSLESGAFEVQLMVAKLLVVALMSKWNLINLSRRKISM